MMSFKCKYLKINRIKDSQIDSGLLFLWIFPSKYLHFIENQFFIPKTHVNLVFGVVLAMLMTVNTGLCFSDSVNSLLLQNKEKKNTCFTAKQVLCLSPSYEKSPYSLGSNSLQQDTSKKKKIVPDNGLAQQAQTTLVNEIDGMVMDATFSPGGYDFYIDFSQRWTPPNGAINYSIVVKEYPGRGVNIVVAIEVNGKQLVYRRMRPVYTSIHDLAVAAANYLNGYIARGDHLRGVDADGNFIDVQRTDITRQIKTPFDIY